MHSRARSPRGAARRDRPRSRALGSFLVVTALGGCSLIDLDHLGSGESRIGSDGDDGRLRSNVEDAGLGDAGFSDPNLLPNGDFEQSFLGWYSFDFAALERVGDTHRSGERALRVSERSRESSGVSFRARHLVDPGRSYRVSAWFRSDAPPQTIASTWKLNCFDDSDREEFQYLSGARIGSEWSELSFNFVAPRCDMDDFMVIFSGPDAGTDFYVDDARLVPAP